MNRIKLVAILGVLGRARGPGSDRARASIELCARATRSTASVLAFPPHCCRFHRGSFCFLYDLRPWRFHGFAGFPACERSAPLPIDPDGQDPEFARRGGGHRSPRTCFGRLEGSQKGDRQVRKCAAGRTFAQRSSATEPADTRRGQAAGSWGAPGARGSHRASYPSSYHHGHRRHFRDLHFASAERSEKPPCAPCRCKRPSPHDGSP